MTGLKLKQHEWTLNKRIGEGGFGKVYAASSAEYPKAVVKLIPKGPGAEREMLFEDLEGVRNVVPIIDRGETEGSWVLVMPRADKSLREHIKAGRLTEAEAITILSDVATALSDLYGKVVHRDLKPENVLLLEGRWCLADFGISRYAEATTAPDTRKYALSPRYAAPEQWRGERATAATDIYAFGVMAYELLTGARPFPGPDYRDQHLHADPTPTDMTPGLAALVEECLFKAPEARPIASNVLARLGRASGPALSGGLAQLEQANRAEVVRRSEEVRIASAVISEEDRRAVLFDSARKSFKRITDSLRSAILQVAPAAELSASQAGGWTLTLAKASLKCSSPSQVPTDPWGDWRGPAFDVIADATLSLTSPQDQFGYHGRSHSLWYCDAHEAGRYAWFETAFMNLPILRAPLSPTDPFALPPDIRAAKAIAPAITEFQVAWPFTALELDDLDEFIDRWAGWLAAGAQGLLPRPSPLPERNPEGSWRRI